MVPADKTSGIGACVGLLSVFQHPVHGFRKGVTLVELMIAMVILTVGVTGLMQSFSFIQKSLQLSKNKTLASNLAQEKMQILKQKAYYQVLVTSDPAHNYTDFAPEVIDYDTGYFPPEIITEGGVVYTRYTYVQVVGEDSGVIGELAPNIPDTGLKRITINVVWGRGTASRKVTMRTMMTNRDTVLSNSSFTGTVQSTNSVAIVGALVKLVEGAGYSDTTDSSGRYNINATPATYTLMASATGYYSNLRSVVIAAGNTQTNNINLTKIGTGRITGYPWLTDHLVISQVVGSTVNAGTGYDQEYVEVFNPTTYTWTMNGGVGLKFQRSGDASARTIQITYANDELPSQRYFLFANTTTISVAGVEVDADAVWSAGNTDFPYFAAQNNIIPVDEDGGGEGGGALELYRLIDDAPLDKLGWDKTGHPAPFFEGAALSQVVGLSRNELYARLTSTADTGGINPGFGPAYDSNNNNLDFYDYSGSVSTAPQNIVTIKPVISGTPAAGAVASCTDGYSSSVEAVLYSNPSPHMQSYAYFNMVDVATGSWTMLISSGAYSLEQATVTIASPGSSYLFASTSTLLTQDLGMGIVTGRVLNAVGSPIPGITVTPGGGGFPPSDGNGRYRIRLSPGVVDLVANPMPGGVSSYVTASSNSIPVTLGEVHSGVDFVLYQGGRVSGFVTRDGVNGLPKVALAILDANSVARDQQVSGIDGRFTSVILSTGLYTVQPALGKLEASVPMTSTVTILSMGATVFSSTFTISGAMGYITGAVQSGGLPIKTGVLIVVTTTTLPIVGNIPVPPDLNFATLTGVPYYLLSSVEDGTYQAEVRGSTSPAYNVYAYCSVPGSTSTITLSSAAYNVPVIAGQTTPGVNFSW